MAFFQLLITCQKFDDPNKFMITEKSIKTIASGCISPYIKNMHLKKLENTYYSIAMDAGTANNSKYLALNATYLP